jgi:hypothetical protein
MYESLGGSRGILTLERTVGFIYVDYQITRLLFIFARLFYEMDTVEIDTLKRCFHPSVLHIVQL